MMTGGKPIFSKTGFVFVPICSLHAKMMKVKFFYSPMA